MSTIEEVRMILPQTEGRWKCGGRNVAIKFANLMRKIVPTTVWTYKHREEGVNFIDLKNIPEDKNIIWIVSYGPHVNRLLRLFKKRKVIYFAQSVGWRISMSPGVPILCGSRFIMSYWAQIAPHNPIYLYKHVIDENCRNWGLDRDIDILYFRRKSTKYLNDILIPELQKHCNVYISNKFISDYSQVLQLYNRSKVYLYSSNPMVFYPTVWRQPEGFGLQPLEAMLCGCTVFSNLHGGLSDYLDSGYCSHQLEIFSKEYDVKRILDAVQNHTGNNSEEDFLRRSYSVEGFYKRMADIWPEIVKFLEFKDRSCPSSWQDNMINIHAAINNLKNIVKFLVEQL